MKYIGKYTVRTADGIWRSGYPYKFCPYIKFGLTPSNDPFELQIQICLSKKYYKMIFIRNEQKFNQRTI